MYNLSIIDTILKEGKMKIDLVYLWVDGNDPKWQEEKEKWQEKLGIGSSRSADMCRFIDNEELRYSLRSVEMNAPWINKIFIVTNGQVPKWLDANHPKIRIVTHEEIMPADALPTFNSEAIEACLMNIPDLSEYFLYANDDMFINRPVTPNFFFDDYQNPIARFAELNWSEELINKSLFLTNVNYSMNLIKSKFGKEYKHDSIHNIEAYRKSLLTACKEIFPNEFEKTTMYKFRSPNSIQRTIYTFYQLATTNQKPQICNNKQNSKEKNLDALYCDITSQQQILKLLTKFNPYLLCINDCENTNPEYRKNFKNFLATLYPESQAWEKNTDKEFIEPAFPNKNARTIVFAPDNIFAKYFSTTLQSLIQNSDLNEYYDIIIFENDITERNKRLLNNMIPKNFSLRYFQIYLTDVNILKLMTPKKTWSISMYYRIFIPLMLHKFDRVLYCDSDIIFNQPIDEFFNIDFEGNEILAVADSCMSKLLDIRPRIKAHLEKDLNLKNPEKYFNSGVIMFNINAIDKDAYYQAFEQYIKTKDLEFPDQDILNVIFEGKAKIIPCKWNYQYGTLICEKNFLNHVYGEYRKEFIKARKNPIIIHYTTPRKPWKDPYREWAEVFWKYAKDTPFFAEIIYSNTKNNNDMLKILNRRWKIYYDYYRSKLLVHLTFGLRKEHYIEKRDHYKAFVNKIRSFKKL